MDNIFLIVNKKIIEEKKIVGILDELFNSDDDDDFDVSESVISENNNKVRFHQYNIILGQYFRDQFVTLKH